MLEGAKQQMMQRAMKGVTPSETQVAQALAEIIAGLEHEQAEAMQQLVDSVGIDADVRHDLDAREQQLLDTADAVAQDRLAEFYLEQVGVENVEQAQQFLDADNWRAQKRTWYEMYRDRDIVDGPPVDTADQSDYSRAADLHVREVFGLRLGQFERVVVGWNRGEAMQELLAGPTVGHTELIETVAAEIDHEP